MSNKWLVWVLLLIADPARGWAPDIISLEEVSLTGARLGAATRDPLAPQYTGAWNYRAALAFRFNILGALYWDNRVHTEAASSAVRTVGWWWMLGLRLHPQVDLFWEHHSRHIVDQASNSYDQYPEQKSRNFPVEDSYGIRFNLYTGDKGRALWD